MFSVAKVNFHYFTFTSKVNRLDICILFTFSHKFCEYVQKVMARSGHHDLLETKKQREVETTKKCKSVSKEKTWEFLGEKE